LRVREPELLLGDRVDAEPVEHGGRYDRVGRPGIDQELELLGDVGAGRIRDLELQEGEAHRGPTTIAERPPARQPQTYLALEYGDLTGRPAPQIE